MNHGLPPRLVRTHDATVGNDATKIPIVLIRLESCHDRNIHVQCNICGGHEYRPSLEGAVEVVARVDTDRI